MTNCIDAAVNSMESSRSSAMVRTVLVHASQPKLRDRHDSVLTGREIGESSVCCGALVAHIATKAPRGGQR